jgi:hypothetical protein
LLKPRQTYSPNFIVFSRNLLVQQLFLEIAPECVTKEGANIDGISLIAPIPQTGSELLLCPHQDSGCKG